MAVANPEIFNADLKFSTTKRTNRAATRGPFYLREQHIARLVVGELLELRFQFLDAPKGKKIAADDQVRKIRQQ
jgi:hypothetical protein